MMGWFADLGNRLSRVRVVCGDWSRITSHAVTTYHGLTGVFLDPPYSDDSGRYDKKIYYEDSVSVAHAVRQFCIERGSDPKLRIALCGYVGEHDILGDLGWTCYRWSSGGGFANASTKHDNANRHKEVVWFSPHCLSPKLELVLADDV